jgi:hypothetical protein
MPRRAVVAVGIGLVHIGVAWVLILDRYDGSSQAQHPDLELFLVLPPPRIVPPPPLRVVGRLPSTAARPAMPGNAPATTVVPPPAASRADAGHRLAGAYGQVLAAADAKRGFGFPAAPDRPVRPPSVFEDPSPRVGTTERTAEGEQILWLTKDCYASLGSTSLTQKDVHAFHRMLPAICEAHGPREPRGDLFAPLRRPTPVLPDN